ncbi:MAG: gliding motility lipoprotein GldH [Saprospiraceae bacterium]|nr:gliding motility lipoprotein GldH [Saprospiraceae bacterium]
MHLLPALVLTLLVLAGCQSERIVYQEKQSVEDIAWEYGEQLGFDFDVTDTARSYRLELEITHTTDFQWENIYLQIVTDYPTDASRTDVVSFELSAPDGTWYGKCRRGQCTVRIPLQQNVSFRHPGIHRLSFEQYMREEQLFGIEALRLRLVRLPEG